MKNPQKGLNLLDVFVFSGTVMRLSGQKVLEGMNYVFRGQLFRSNRLRRQKTKRHVKSRYHCQTIACLYSPTVDLEVSGLDFYSSSMGRLYSPEFTGNER